jgi:peptidoglycan/xylan/chitin deacetylase (PgdA/CDA1 family)
MALNLYSSAHTASRITMKSICNLIDPPVVVLIYHRVTTLHSDPEMLAVTPENFRAQMQYLKDTVPLVRFEEDWSKMPRPAVAITFDDGYADNALEALPILEEVGVPATFFVSTGTIGATHGFWWDELVRIILDAQSLPANFILSDRRLGRKWPTGTFTERQAFYDGIVRLMNDGDTDLRNNWLAQIRHWAQDEKGSAGAHRAMTLDELRLLSKSRLVTIGTHTVSHTRLSALSTAAQQDEISTSKRQLEAWLGREITVISYPFGRRCDYTEKTVAICRDAGLAKAAANFPGQAHRWTDLYQIPRQLVRNWPIETFEEKLIRFWRT